MLAHLNDKPVQAAKPVVAINLKEFIDIGVVALYLYLMESICRSDSCYLSQNRFPGSNLYDIDNIVFVFAAGCCYNCCCCYTCSYVVLLYQRLAQSFSCSVANELVIKFDWFST
jgi:hypothetical protein